MTTLDRVRSALARGVSAVRESPTCAIILRRLPLAAGLSALLLPLIGVTSYAMVWAGGGAPPGEFDRFGPAGASLLTGQWSLPYSDNGVQAGPFELAPYGLWALLGVSGLVGWTVVAIVGAYLLTVALLLSLFLPRDADGRRLTLVVPLAVGAIGCLGGFVTSAISSGHPSQVVIPLLWVLAGCFAREQRFVAFGIVIGLSTGWEVWGVLGAPLVLLAARPRIVRAAIATVATMLVIYLPFVLAGPFRMFEKVWAIDPATLAHALLPGAETFTWPLRLAQTVIAVGIGVTLIVLCRSTEYALWLAPLAIVATRLALDPLAFAYYWIAPATIALVLAGVLALRRAWVSAAAAALVPALTLVPGGRAPWAAVLVVAGCLGAGILVAIRTRQSNAKGAGPFSGSTPSRAA